MWGRPVPWHGETWTARTVPPYDRSEVRSIRRCVNGRGTPLMRTFARSPEEDGRLDHPDGPGVGVDLDEAPVRKSRVVVRVADRVVGDDGDAPPPEILA